MTTIDAAFELQCFLFDDALCYDVPHPAKGFLRTAVSKLIVERDALRAALTKAQPVCYVNGDELSNILDDRTATIATNMSGYRRTPLYACPIAQPVQPEDFVGTVRLYNLGYRAGHEDTVEGVYADVARSDLDSYHAETVAELIAEGSALAQPTSITTGWPAGMLQDDSREFSRWLSSKPNARQEVRDAIAQPVQPADRDTNIFALHQVAIIAGQVLRDMQAQDLLIEWQTVLEEAIDAIAQPVQLTRKALSDAEIARIFDILYESLDANEFSDRRWFFAGVTLAEESHGIGTQE